MRQFAKTCLNFIKREAVLCAAVLLAVVSAFFVPPSISYVSYIDWDTLALLFGLMAVMKGFQKAGLFTYLGNQLECEFGGNRYFGIVANTDFILISTYEENLKNPELVLYKKR